ncbi:DUF1559 family PulG-like putative transporter [Calycomorphotria hydatis]|uniref:DUF1559 domain-containing protein n=1 Tax=Calycomorphotria hydatis TaxID=2528027 RepID=A0A517T6T5_9PLAN|nr:DUF1559 domain-containing protein [Calycomorphotria hydatis]QDT64086.1 hypothetical protein V22_13170 [Calycomorphotria hydatis]
MQQAREAARRTQCKSNLKQLALGTANHVDQFGVLPPARISKNWATWAVFLLPLIEQSSAFNAWDLKATYYLQTDEAGTDPSVFYCPSRRSPGMKLAGDTSFNLSDFSLVRITVNCSGIRSV